MLLYLTYLREENVPILEQAFMSNAYPNRDEKERLAKETTMHYKQVDVWVSCDASQL